MSDIKVRADELGREHIGKYFRATDSDWHKIHSIEHRADESVVRWNGGNIGDVCDLDDVVTLSDTPPADLPTEPGSMVVATVGKEQYRVVLTRIENDEMWEWLHESGEGWNDFDLSDPVELVAVPKAEYGRLVSSIADYESDEAILKAATRLIVVTNELNASLS